MSMRETINKLRAFLAEENVEQPMNFTDIKTNDDMILSFEGELVAGVEIFIVDEAGRTPAPDGDYMVEDNKIIVKDGKVEAIEPVVPEEMPVEEEAPVADVPVEAEEKPQVNLEELVGKIAQLEADYLSLKEVIEKLAETTSKETFKEEVKMSIHKPTTILKEMKSEKLIKKINPLEAYAVKR